MPGMRLAVGARGCANSSAPVGSQSSRRRAMIRCRWRRSSCCPRCPTPRRSSASGSTTAPTPPRAGSSRRESPTFFAKFRNALRPDGATVTLPAASEKVDYEAEIAFVVGSRARDVAEADAIDHLAGYALLQRPLRPRPAVRDPAMDAGQGLRRRRRPAGRRSSRRDEAGPADALGIALDLNGERMQEATTADLSSRSRRWSPTCRA